MGQGFSFLPELQLSKDLGDSLENLRSSFDLLGIVVAGVPQNGHVDFDLNGNIAEVSTIWIDP